MTRYPAAPYITPTRAYAGVTFVLGLLNLAALRAFGSYGQLCKVAAVAEPPIVVSSKDDVNSEQK